LLALRHKLGRPSAVAPQAPALLVLHVGAPAPGMNAVVASVTRSALARGWRAIGAYDGLRGLSQGQTTDLHWMSVDGWVSRGGASLGTNRDSADCAPLVPRLKELGIRAVVVVGGFEAIDVAESLYAYGVPVAVVPATISNNLPGTWRSIGSDTACNAVIEATDRLRQSAVGARNRVFVVEVMGRRCGALAASSAVGAGAELVFTHEDAVGLSHVQAASRSLNQEFDDGRSVGLVLVADGIAAPFDARSLAKVFEAESGDRFDTRLCVLGHLQQGGRPAPMDRLDGARLGEAAVEGCTQGASGAVLVGLDGHGTRIMNLADVNAAADRPNRRPLNPGYAGVLDLARSLGAK
ncbi:MAG: 6-phosphofructokinase, partial [Myxococcota bacterium]